MDILKHLDNKTKNRIIGALRQEFKYSPLYQEAKRRYRVEKHEGKFKNGRDKYGVYYRCAMCKELFKDKQIQIDHKIPIGPQGYSLDGWLRRAWCIDTGGADNLQALCKEKCHKAKTIQDKKNIWHFNNDSCPKAKNKTKKFNPRKRWQALKNKWEWRIVSDENEKEALWAR